MAFTRPRILRPRKPNDVEDADLRASSKLSRMQTFRFFVRMSSAFTKERYGKEENRSTQQEAV